VDEGNIQRKLTAIFSADAVGYSRLMRDDELATVSVLSEYRELMGGLILQHKGRIVDTPGDNILAEFGSVVDAVQSAVVIQRELEARNADLPKSRRMEFRIGINIGDVIQEADRIYGDGVNIAARLEKIAEPGGICISRSAYDQIESKLPFGYRYLGEKDVKNIDKPLYAYQVLLNPENDPNGADRATDGNTSDNRMHSAGTAHDGLSDLKGRLLRSTTDKIRDVVSEVTGGLQPGEHTRRLENRVQDLAGDMARVPAERGKPIQRVTRSQHIRVTLGFGLSIFAVNLFTSFGSWWFQYPLLSAGLVSYLVWVKGLPKTSKRILAMREKILNEEIANLPGESEPTGRDIKRIDRRTRIGVRFYRSLYIYLGVSAFLVLVNLTASPSSLWFQFPLIIWGFFLFLHWGRASKHLPK